MRSYCRIRNFSGHDGLPLCQRGGASLLVNVTADEVAVFALKTDFAHLSLHFRRAPARKDNNRFQWLSTSRSLLICWIRFAVLWMVEFIGLSVWGGHDQVVAGKAAWYPRYRF